MALLFLQYKAISKLHCYFYTIKPFIYYIRGSILIVNNTSVFIILYFYVELKFYIIPGCIYAYISD